MKLSIVIPAYNAQDTLPKLLESLKEQITPTTEVIIVDDCSSDSTSEIAKAYDFVSFIQLDRNAGPAHARNEGVRRAKGEIIWFLDSDTILAENSLGHLMAQHEKHPEVVGIQGCYMVEPANPSFGTWYKSLTTAQWYHGGEIKPTRVVETCNGSVLKSSFLQVGGFDENYLGADVEDYEFGFRLTETEGELLFDPTLRVYHHFPGIIQNLKNYAKRSFMWTKLFLLAGEFDEGATSKDEAFGRTMGALLLCSLIFAFALTAFADTSSWIWLVPGLLGCVYAVTNRSLFGRFASTRGAPFLFAAIFVHLAESVTVFVAAGLAAATSPQAVIKGALRRIHSTPN